ncbi:MAG TPA: MerR family DNA-binding protein [Solimonas sp.]|nr:MerR family DNA-binding protein [Solimonas sp.]
MQGLTIGKLAKHAGVGIDTVRFYERAGLLPKAPRSASGYRLYALGDADRLRFIRRAKALGFSLEEIAELLLLNAGTGSRASVRRLAQRRLDDLNHKIDEMTSIRDALSQLVRRCSGDGPVKGCPIIESVVSRNPAAHCPEK